jgi:hypothetical protein
MENKKEMDRVYGAAAIVWGILCIYASYNAFDTAEVLKDGTIARIVGFVLGAAGVTTIGTGGYLIFRDAR